MNIKNKAVAGVKWVLISNALAQLFQLFFMLVLARLISPREVGLLGMVTVFTGFAASFSELGFRAVLIQRKVINEKHYSSVFWLNFGMGVLLFSIMYLISGSIGVFYHEPTLMPLTRLVAVTYIINSFGIVTQAKLNRTMNFRRLALIDTTAVLVSGGVAITMASRGFGVWSLAWSIVVSACVTQFLYLFKAEWRPSRVFSLTAIKELLGFSGNVFAYNLYNYWVRNSDNLLIGKYLGSVELGVYSRAYSLMLMPLNFISSAFSQVMFPALSLIQDDKTKVKEIYLKTIASIALITFPMMLGLWVVSDVFVRVMLGVKWLGVIPFLEVFSLLGLVQSVATTTGWIYLSQGRADLQLRFMVVASAMIIGSIIIGILLGSSMAVAVSYAFTSGILLFYPCFAIPGRLINMTVAEVLRKLSGILACAIFMAAVVWYVGRLLPESLNVLVKLIIQVLAGGLIYLVLIEVFTIEAYGNIKQELFRRRTV